MYISKNFPLAELQCHCGCGQMKIPEKFLRKLQELRDVCGFPLPLNSAYRCPAHDRAVGGAGAGGPHTIAAVDVGVYGAQAVIVLRHALIMGFTGIGISQKGPVSSRFLHLDMVPSTPAGPRPGIWSY